MKKRYFFVVLLLFPVVVLASDNTSFMIGNKAYNTLEEAISNATSTDTVELFSNANFSEPYEITKTVNIDLNGNDITAPSTVFQVNGGTLNITGKGLIKELKPYYGVIKVIGNTENTNSLYSRVTIGKDVTLQGWSGISISHNNNKSYGISIDLDGTINAISDIDGGNGIGVYVNGNIQHEDTHPVINISDNAKIYSNGTGLYIAGYSTFNIKNAYVEGIESGISMKSGHLNINGASIICTGEDATPTEGYNNGVNSSGAAIQIESNNGYAGKMEIDISSGNIRSKNSSVIYEYIGKGDTTQVKSINITGGAFVSEANKNVFLLSNNFKSTHTSFISGGKYSSDPSSYLKAGYTSNNEEGMYNVSKSVIAAFAEKIDNNNTISNIGIIIILVTLLIIVFINRLKIINIFKNLFYR